MNFKKFLRNIDCKFYMEAL